MDILRTFPSTDLSTASIQSDPISIDNLSGFSLCLILSGSPVGSFKLQASNDPVEEPASVSSSSWVDIVGSSYSVSASGPILWNHSAAYFKWLRCIWTKTSGTGAITNATLNVKIL